MSIAGSMGKSLLARAIVFPVTALAALVTTSIVVQSAGSVLFGVISLVSTIVQLVPFTDLGLGAAVINEISGTSDPNRRKSVLVTAVRKLLLPTLVVLLIAPTGLFIFSWADVLGVTQFPSENIDLATTAVIVIFGLSIPFGLGQRALIGLGKNHIGVAITTIASLTTLLLTWIISNTELDPIYLAICAPTASLIASCVAFTLAWRLLRVDAGMEVDYKSSKITGLFSQAAPMIVIMIGMPIAFQSHRLLLSYRSSTTELASYSLAMQFYLPLWSFVSVAATSLWPIFASRRSQGLSQTRGVLQSGLILGALGIFFALSLILLGPWAGKLVSNGEIALGTTLLLAAAFLLVIQTLQQVPGMFLTDAAGLWFQALCIALLSAWTIATGWLITPALGASGPLIATCSGVLFVQLVPGLMRMRRQLRA